MKKVLSILAVAALSAAFVSCGPSKEEMEKRAKEVSDSTAAIAQHETDSLAAVAAEAEAAAAAAATHATDSTRAAFVTDSTAHAGKKGGKH